MAETNTLAYFAGASMLKRKWTVSFTPEGNTIKLFTALINSLP